jgi:hypothetical protein
MNKSSMLILYYFFIPSFLSSCSNFNILQFSKYVKKHPFTPSNKILTLNEEVIIRNEIKIHEVYFHHTKNVKPTNKMIERSVQKSKDKDFQMCKMNTLCTLPHFFDFLLAFYYSKPMFVCLPTTSLLPYVVFFMKKDL